MEWNTIFELRTTNLHERLRLLWSQESCKISAPGCCAVFLKDQVVKSAAASVGAGQTIAILLEDSEAYVGPTIDASVTETIEKNKSRCTSG